MKKENRWYGRLKAIAGALVLVAVLAAGLSSDAFTIVSRADSAGKITATSAKIRKSASTSSDTLASVARGDSVSVKGQTTGSDGYTWYQVVVNGSETGYIRSDLMEITDGSTPASLTNSTTTQTTPSSSTPTTSTPDETVVEVTAVEPISGNVSGTSPVRVRQNASTTSRIVSTAQGGLALTVTGTANGTDGKEWYQVTFSTNGTEVQGFIRADYVSVSGELTLAGTQTEQPEVPAEPAAEEPDTKEETKDWETYYQNETWHLLDNTSGKSYDIQNIFDTVQANNDTLTEVIATNKTQQIVIVALVILAVVLISVISILFFKLKDANDAAYFEAAERENARRRNGDRPAQRPQGSRPAQGGQRSQNGSRPAQNGEVRRQRPAGQQAPSGRTGSGERPATAKNGNGSRPAGQKARQVVSTEHAVKQRPAEELAQEEVQIAETPVQEQYAEEREPKVRQTTEQPQRPQHTEEQPRKAAPERRARNFADDDEFEFQFLDWDEEQE